MITHIKEYLSAQIPPSDLCIVGAGAAGMELIRQLNHTSHSITLLESGFEDFDWQTQKLGRFKQIGKTIRSADHTHYFGIQKAKKQEPHLRQLGGTLNIWGRRWKNLDPFDLLPKPYVQESGWPLSYEDLYPHLNEIAKEYEVLELMQEPENLLNISLLTKDYPCFSTKINLKEKKPTNIKHLFYDPIQHSSNIRLILGANVVNLVLTEDLKHIDHLIVRSLDGHEWKVRSKLFVLACGTIENTRLLLCSNKQMRTGIGNENDWVGRNLIDHPQGKAGLFLLFPQHKKFPEAYTYPIENKWIDFEIALHPKLLTEWQLPNHCMRLLYMPELIDQRFIEIIFHLEQLPNPESRIFLSDEVDELNMPLACLDWKFKDLDLTLFRRYLEKMKELFLSNNIGMLSFDESCYNMHFLFDASHQMGTTRMALDPRNGVVDINCKIFGVDNLYIAGSSVFPSGGNANPTFTILALSRRLAIHLKDFLKQF